MTCGDMKYACVCNTDDFDRNSAASRHNSLISLSSPLAAWPTPRRTRGTSSTRRRTTGTPSSGTRRQSVSIEKKTYSAISDLDLLLSLLWHFTVVRE